MNPMTRCTACGEEYSRDPWSRKPDWASLAASDGHCWPAKPPTPDGGQELLETPPVVGNSYDLYLGPGDITAEHPCFWTVFRPPISTWNGWEEAPHELRESCLVHCRSLGPGTIPSSRRVSCLDVLPFPAIGRRFPPVAAGEISLWPGNNPSRFEVKDMVYLSGNLEGDVGEWGVFQRTSAGASLIVYGSWGHHEDDVFAGHRHLSREEFDRLDRRFP